jgi:2-methylcitrate dehydratase PrpD
MTSGSAFPNATETIAHWVARTSSTDIPSFTATAAKEIIFDCLGLMLSGSTEPVGQMIQNFVVLQGGSPDATMLPSGGKTSVANAAFANGTMGMALDYDPEPQMMALAAALLSVAESKNASGEELITAFVAGSELAWAMGHVVTVDMERRGLHPQGFVGAIPVACACAKLMKLGEDEMSMAMGLAASMGGGLFQSEGSMAKPLLGGMIARNGVIAAQLAKLGVSSGKGLFDNLSGFCGTSIAEGVYDWTNVAAALGRPFRLQELKRVRRYPCCGTLHSILDSALGLLEDEQLDHHEIEEVEIDQSYRSIVMRFDPPENDHQARFSLRFAIAAALVDGTVGVHTFTGKKLRDPNILRMMQRIRINIKTIWEVGAGDRKVAVPVTIRLKNGRTLIRSTQPDQVLGSYKNPAGLDFIVSKFRENASLVLAPQQVERAIEVWSPAVQVSSVAMAIEVLVATA